jgi:hypothetical protein
MKGFIKFASILTFGVFCFIGGVDKGQGKGSAALYCILVGTMVLLNGFATVTEIETNELMENNRKRTDELLKKTAKLGSKMKEIGK